uniref:CD44 n=1 Tax=Pelusios castaneus TaxID=367368 RepID=A0A8C8S3X0_9SAUR
MDAYGEPKRIKTTQDPLLHNVYLGGDKDEDKYPTNTSVDSVKPALSPTMERDHSSSNMTVNNEIGHNTYIPTVVVSSEGAKKEEPTQDPLLNGTYPGWSNKVEYSTNANRDDILLGVTRSHGNEHSTTAEFYNDKTKYEDSTHSALSPADPGWGREDKYPTNTTRDEVLHGFILTNESEHEDESSHTAVVSDDGTKHEDSTKDQLATGIQLEKDNEDKYPTNNINDNVMPGVFPDFESGHGREPASTATSFTSNERSGRKVQLEPITPGSQPRSAQIPEWLIVVAALLVLALVLAVCIAVNSRTRCGQRRKLVINDGKGSVSDKKMSGVNGEASKSQEMVHLVHQEQPDNQKGSCDEFLTKDETQNEQEADMKTGV